MENKVLVYGFGNPGRQDDGLGAALIGMLEGDSIPGIKLDCNYQLNIEDACDIACCGRVVFVDASRALSRPYDFYEIEPAAEITFTTHTLSPQSLLALTHELYGTDARGFILEIKGAGWDFHEGLTETARENLKSAHAFIKDKLYEMISTCNKEKEIPHVH